MLVKLTLKLDSELIKLATWLVWSKPDIFCSYHIIFQRVVNLTISSLIMTLPQSSQLDYSEKKETLSAIYLSASQLIIRLLTNIALSQPHNIK